MTQATLPGDTSDRIAASIRSTISWVRAPWRSRLGCARATSATSPCSKASSPSTDVAAPVSEERLPDLATLLTRELGETLPVGPDVAADMARAIITAALVAAAHHADAVPSDAGMPGVDPTDRYLVEASPAVARVLGR